LFDLLLTALVPAILVLALQRRWGAHSSNKVLSGALLFLTGFAIFVVLGVWVHKVVGVSTMLNFYIHLSPKPIR
jgi:hypothetical protein